MEKRVQDYSKEILKIIRSNTSPAVMGGRLQDYHENEGDRRGKVQVVRNVLPFDRVAYQIELAVAELLGNIEGAY